MEWINEHSSILQFVLTGMFTVVVFIMLLVFVKRREHELLKAEVQQIKDTYNTEKAHISLARQVNTIEVQIKELPTGREIHDLEKDVGELKGILTGINQLQKRMNYHVDMLVENEIKGSKK